MTDKNITPFLFVPRHSGGAIVVLCAVLFATLGGTPRLSHAASCASAVSALSGSCSSAPKTIAPSPASPLKNEASSPFTKTWRLTLQEKYPNPSSEQIHRQVATWVATKILPHPTPPQTLRLQTEIARLAAQGFPLTTLAQGTHVEVQVTKETLNTLARHLLRAVSNQDMTNHVVAIRSAGGSPKENTFADKNLTSLLGDVSSPTISDTLYALSQVPGYTRADGLLVPSSSTPLDQILNVHITPSPTFAGSQLEIDNYGYAATGAVTLNATGSASNVGVVGGLFNVMASTSFSDGMNSGQVGYSLPIGLYTRVGADIQAMNYSLNQGFSPWGHGASSGALAALGVSGDNYSGDLWSTQRLTLKEDRSLTLKELAFVKAFTDTYSSTEQNTRVITGGTLDLSGSRRLGNLFLSGDLSDTEYSLSQGVGSSPINPFYYDTQGLQNYFQGNAQAVYVFNPTYSVTLGTIDQQYIGGGTLDPMLQGTLGGVYTIMALPTASLFGNDMYVGTLTFTRSDLTKKGIFQSSLFFDAGQVTGVGTNYAAMGPGGEESWSLSHYFAKADLAVPVGALPTGASALGTNITALTGGNIGQGGIPLQLWLSAGIRY